MATVAFGHYIDQCETQARSTPLPRALERDTVKAIEQTRQFLRGYTHTLIPHTAAQLAVFDCYCQGDRAVGIAVPDRVVQQVHQRTFQQAAVS